MAEPPGLAVAVEQLAKFLADSNSGSIFPCQEVAQKIELLPMDMKIEGAANYLRWSQRALLVVVKELDGHLLGTVGEQRDKTTVEGKKWKVTNSYPYWVVVELSGTLHWAIFGGPIDLY